MIDGPSLNPFDLARQYLADWTPGVIFDVGANIGQSAKAFARQFPEATIHCFEPSPDAFLQLVMATARLPKVRTHCLALGQADATLGLTQDRYSAMNRLLPAGTQLPDGAVKVQVRHGAAVMQELGLPHVGYLKIDTEGHDHEVLLGFLPVLDRVDFIEVEAAMNPYNTTHVPLARFEDLLRPLGFQLFHIFEQKMEWKRGGRPVLRRCNPVFINGRLADLTGIR